MSRLVTATIPLDYENVLMGELHRNRYVFRPSLITSNMSANKVSQVTFIVRSKHLQGVITHLTQVGCGKQWGTIDVTPLLMTRPSIRYKDRSMKKSYVISDRMPVDEIQELIEEGNHLTFDFLALISIASLIAGAGLVGDNVVFVIASMLVSPLMGPILSTTFGLAIQNYDIVYRGLRNETWGVFISMLTGFLLGVCSSFVYNPEFHSHEMISRGTVSSLTLGLLVAAPSGMGVILAVSKGGFNAIVGTAISASLLPPIVNSGLCLGFGLMHWMNAKVSDHDTNRFARLGVMSLVLWFTNFCMILIIGFLTFRYIKNIRPSNEHALDTEMSEPLVGGNSPGVLDDHTDGHRSRATINEEYDTYVEEDDDDELEVYFHSSRKSDL